MKRTSLFHVVRRSLVALLPVVALIALTAAGAGATPARQGFSRPVVVLASYSPTGGVEPGDTFTLQFRLANSGEVKARNIVINLGGAEFIPAERDIPIVRGFQGAATLGYMRLDMRDSFFRDSSGLVGEAIVMARLSKRMTGQLLFSRGYQFSIYSGASYFFSTTMGAGLTRHLSKKADLTYDFTYGRTSYPEFGQGDLAADRYYRYLTHGLRLGLRLARHLGMAFYGSYGQRDRGAYEPIRDRFFAGVSLFFGAAGEGLSVPARGGSQRQAIGSGFAKAAKL